MSTRPTFQMDHINYEPSRSRGISPLLAIPAETITVTDEEKARALWALAGHASDAEELKDVAEMLGLIDPPKPDLCQRGHMQDDHGVTGPYGQRYCLACHKSLVER